MLQEKVYIKGSPKGTIHRKIHWTFPGLPNARSPVGGHRAGGMLGLPPGGGGATGVVIGSVQVRKPKTPETHGIDEGSQPSFGGHFGSIQACRSWTNSFFQRELAGSAASERLCHWTRSTS